MSLRDWEAGARLGVTLLSVVPVRAERVDREAARRAMVLAPAVGLIVGGAGSVVLLVAGWLGFSRLLGAALAVAVGAALTRALHLDGLADLADGLGSRKPAEGALDIMKKSDIGPFGVATLVLTLLIQVAALASAPAPAVSVLVAAVAGRLALPWACRAGVPSARPGGLGALVAGSVPVRAVAVVSVAVLVAAAAFGFATDGPGGLARAGAAVVVALGTALATLRHAVRRLGGVTGDVLGALVEAATAAALLAQAVR
ncbi:adenosylcobinamide-GDP ribazoletransferase [Actinomadura rupiterrae]|uniref:adenosylcobinamide-GDP ribazoletransferase n=1 Tax=Actinomadura rupiterrae TaxID=559627 RepID=UPI0020A4EC03|nr:adenosylcobinamide-GDP ribazoletransferase [Actinomadura rupiterrae]MCP2338525.1 adenosylcobinamide-GDP ribazoletransferase [Actinomadura rupiterrae]